MSKNNSQLQIIATELVKKGHVSRNWALSKFITRLTSRIYDLKCLGWEFDTMKVPTLKPNGEKGWDYVYKVRKIGAMPTKEM
jgi:hypothetical protein